MKIFHFSFGGLILVFLMTSCVTDSEQPLSPPESAQQDKRLTGVWAGKLLDEDDILWLHFIEAKDSMTDVVWVGSEEEGAELLFCKMHPTIIGEHRYMNLKPYVPENYAAPELIEEMEEFNYLLVKYELSDDILKIWMLTNAIGDAIEQGELEGTIEKGKWMDNITITDAPENIRECFQKADHEKIFELSMVFRKVDVQPAVLEDFEEQIDEHRQGESGDVDKSTYPP